MPYGYFKFMTIKDYDEKNLDKRIAEMVKRGYVLLAKKKRNWYGEVVHFAKLEDTKEKFKKEARA